MGLVVDITAKRALGAAVLAATCAFAATHGVLAVGGGSMEPALHAGDVAVFRRGGEGVSETDMIVFSKRGWAAPVIHRVARMTPAGEAVTRGDANPVADLDPVTGAEVRGRVVAVVPTARLVRSLAGLARDARLAFKSHSQAR